MASLHEQCMDAIITAIEALPLASGVAGRVYKQKLPVPALIEYPCCLVTLKGCRQELSPLSTEEDDRILPVAVHLLDRQDPKDGATLSPWLIWLEQLPLPFLSEQLAAATKVLAWENDLDMMDAIDAQKALGPAYQHAESSFFVRNRCATVRGYQS